MGSLQSALSVEGLLLHGTNGSGDGKIEAPAQESTRIEVLDEKVTYKSGCFERGQRWLRGIHPKLGVISRGLTGWETVQDFERFRPIHTFTVVGPNLQEQSCNCPSPHDGSKTHISEIPPQQSSDVAGPDSHEKPSQAE